MTAGLPRIAVFAGPTATILNTPDLITSNKARTKYGLPGSPQDGDLLRPQRLAAPVTVYIEAYSAHPLEKESAHLYAEPDGWLDAQGVLHDQCPDGEATAVFAVGLHPDDGLYPLPYMARQMDGSAWEQTAVFPWAPQDAARQTFLPDAQRLYEEIDRFGIADHGEPVRLYTAASFDFFRAAPSGGYPSQGERAGEDFFVYYPYHLQTEPGLQHLAQLTNQVQQVLGTGEYAGLQWLEGSPTVDETTYWLGLLIDTTGPIVGHAAHRRHQSLGSDGGRNIVDGVKYLTSGVALDADHLDRVGACVIVDELVYSARDVTKTDGRPGGYSAAGGHGGVVADMGGYSTPRLTYIPHRRQTHRSALRLTTLPDVVPGVSGDLTTGPDVVKVQVKNQQGLCPDAIPHVSITKYSRYAPIPGDRPDAVESEVEVFARIQQNLNTAPLAGFVCEGMSPYGMADPLRNRALEVAIFAGMPVVRTGRGHTGGMAYKGDPACIAGDNLTAIKARILLMAALLKLGALPPAKDPFHPTDEERAVTYQAVARFQELFDTH